VWNAATNVCRGLIVFVGPKGLDENAVVVARPFNKFHNLNTEYVPETLEANLPTDAPPLVTRSLTVRWVSCTEWDGKICGLQLAVRSTRIRRVGQRQWLRCERG
jgi:hypothetical protein